MSTRSRHAHGGPAGRGGDRSSAHRAYPQRTPHADLMPHLGFRALERGCGVRCRATSGESVIAPGLSNGAKSSQMQRFASRRRVRPDACRIATGCAIADGRAMRVTFALLVALIIAAAAQPAYA